MREVSSGVLRSVLALSTAMAMIAAAGVSWFTIGPGGATSLPDLAIYRDALAYQASGGDLYAFASVDPRTPGAAFTYPPFAALVLQPLVWVPAVVSDVAWVLLNLAAVGMLALVLALRYPAEDMWMGLPRGRSRQVIVAALACTLLLVSYPVATNFRLGQISLFITAAAFLDAAHVVPKRWRGCLVGLVSSIKLTPLVFIPYFLVTRQWRAAANAFGVFVIAGALAWAVFPMESVDYWTRQLWTTSRVAADPAVSRNKSLWGLVLRWEGSADLPTLLVLVVCAVVAVLALWRAKRLFESKQHVEAALVVGCLSIAITPISWPHHQPWGVLAALVLALGTGWFRIAGLFAVGAFLAYAPTSSTQEHGPLALRMLWEVPTLFFIGVAVLGLPRAKGVVQTHGQEEQVGARRRR